MLIFFLFTEVPPRLGLVNILLQLHTLNEKLTGFLKPWTLQEPVQVETLIN